MGSWIIARQKITHEMQLSSKHQRVICSTSYSSVYYKLLIPPHLRQHPAEQGSRLSKASFARLFGYMRGRQRSGCGVYLNSPICYATLKVVIVTFCKGPSTTEKLFQLVEVSAFRRNMLTNTTLNRD